ncbi:GNAT family N-acetyltransferase [Streptomyces sp. NPDC056411]|uniref:GNAT family N-acetyltransferase n=1 Tax=Streptomyces sp. NPDC056411 TaxID=3345813 RepID=UPI0035DB2562
MQTVGNRSELVRGLQERAARAQPAEQVERIDGWWLRRAPGSAWWVGSVLPHGASGPDAVLRGVLQAEQFYAGHGGVARFQISPAAGPEGLDAVLAARGYRRHSAVSLQVAPVARVREHAGATPLRVRRADRPTRAWRMARQAVTGAAGDARAEGELLDRVALPSAYACAVLGDEVVAVGRAVLDTGWAGVFDLATLPRARGRGAARQVLAALAGWAGAHGADAMYLQVERDNVPALRLYERAGFRELCEYHYRTAE